MLNEFLVLGQVPGTNLQITFTELMLLFDIALILLMLEKKLDMRKQVSYYWIYIHFYFLAKKSQHLRLPA